MYINTKQFESKLTPEELARHKSISQKMIPAHIFRDDSYGFSYAGDIEELRLLSESSNLYVSLKQKRLMLLQVLKRKGVAFKDIQAHLWNQAQAAGLWPKGAKVMHVSRFEWYVQMDRFNAWVWRNFKNYGEPIESVVKKPKAPKAKEIIVRRESKKQEPVEPATLPPKVAPKNIPELESFGTLHVASSTPTDRPDAIVLGNEPTIAPPSPGIFDKLIDSLTPLQIQTLVFKNLSILGAKALELGAATEFNLLMEAMGLEHEMIPESAVSESITAQLDA